MNSYVEMQMRLVADRQQAYLAEAREARLVAVARALPAASAASRPASVTWPADGEPIAMSPRSLGAAAVGDRTSGRDAAKPHGCGEHAAAA